MKIKLVVIDFEVPARVKRIALGAGIPAVLLGAAAIANAGVPHAFNPGEVLKASDLNGNFNALDQGVAALDQRIAALEQATVADPPCPVGYAHDPSPASPFNPASILCKKGDDEVVKVGVDGSAFWIDRHEASVWTAPEGPATGMQLFTNADDTSAGFPKNGQVTSPLYALSVTGVVPGRNITWFQSAEACRASGKRLPLGDEWLAAARGTRDPGANDGFASNKCNTQGATARSTGLALGPAVDASCVSDWGAEDMIGNVWEWTSEWHAAPSMSGSTDAYSWPDPPNATFNGDSNWNISSYAFFNGLLYVQGMPAVAARGSNWSSGVGAGVFALSLTQSPASHGPTIGFRCVVPR